MGKAGIGKRVINQIIKKLLVKIRIHNTSALAAQLVREPPCSPNTNGQIFGEAFYRAANGLTQFKATQRRWLWVLNDIHK